MKFCEFLNDRTIFENGYRRMVPRASVVMPTYARNSEGLLAGCIESVLNQTYRDFEFIIVDDGSVDGSEAMICSYAERDPRIVYVRHDINSGLPAVRTNEAILLARSPYIGFIFDDNIWYSETLQAMINSISLTGADIVYGPAILDRGGDDPVLGTFPLSLEILQVLNTIANGGVMCDRNFFSTIGLYDPHLIIRRLCDWDLWLRALKRGMRFHRIEKILGIEKGLMSPTSLGNAVKFDYKVTLSYIFDTELEHNRTTALRPERIMEYNVFDPEKILYYVRNWSEWEQVRESVYQPFFQTHPYYSYQSPIPNNRRFDSNVYGYRLDPPTPIFRNRKRILILTTRLSRIVADWVDALKKDSDNIVIVSSQWSAPLFNTLEIDLLILVDMASQALLPFVEACREKSIPVIYIVVHGLESAYKERRDPLAMLDLMRNRAIYELLKCQVYFGLPGVPWPESLWPEVRSLMEISDQVVITAGGGPNKLTDGLPILQLDFVPNDIPNKPDSVKELSLAMYLGDASRLKKDTLEAGASLLARTPAGVRWSIYILPGTILPDRFGLFAERLDAVVLFETLPSLVARSRGVLWVVPQEILSRYTRYLLLLLEEDLANSGSCLIRLGSDTLPQVNKDALHPHVLDHWKLVKKRANGFRTDSRSLHLANIVQGVVLRRKIADLRGCGRAGDMKSMVLISSRALAGSEIYGLSVTKTLANVGFDVRTCMNHSDELSCDEMKNLNDWLQVRGLPQIIEAEYGQVDQCTFLSSIPQQALQRYADDLSRWLDSQEIGLVFCSAFIPEPIIRSSDKRLTYMALFAPWNCNLGRMAYLRDRLAGVVSDSQWAVSQWNRWLGPPAACVPSLVETECFTVHNSALSPNPICIALADGTFQVRSCQKEAIIAVLGLLRDGWDLHLNLYGYELSILEECISEVKGITTDPAITERISFNGSVKDPSEISQNNHIVLSSSSDESQHQDIIFNMASGLLAVACPAGGLDEMVQDGLTGFLARGFSVEDVTDALRRALSVRDKWPQIISRARHLVLERCTEQIFTSQLLDVMERGADICLSHGYQYFGASLSGDAVVTGKKQQTYQANATVSSSIDNLVIGPDIGLATLRYRLLPITNGLAGLAFQLCTFHTRPQGKLNLKVKTLGDGQILRSVGLDLNKVHDNEWFRIEFEPIVNSKNKLFVVAVTAAVVTGRLAIYERHPVRNRTLHFLLLKAQRLLYPYIGLGSNRSLQAFDTLFKE